MSQNVTVDEVFQAYYDCRRLKRNTWNALRFEENLERNLMDLFHRLEDGSYKPGRSMCFVVDRPKVREVWAADFADRIAHHVLYNRISEAFYRTFIRDTFACIPGRGTLMAANRLQSHIRSATENGKRKAWYLKADIANFFVSINKAVLDGILVKQVREPWTLWLCRTLLHHDPTRNVFVRSPKWLLDKVPPHKSLFNAQGRGMPIGNLTSQFFANVYLNPLDQYAKHQLKLRRYARYVDDVVAIGPSGEAMHAAFTGLRDFARQALGIDFHPQKTLINTVDKGVNFVGYIIRAFCKYVRKSTLGNFYYKARSAPFWLDLDRIRSTTNSYMGMLRHCNAWKERGRVSDFLFDFHGCRMDAGRTKMII